MISFHQPVWIDDADRVRSGVAEVVQRGGLGVGAIAAENDHVDTEGAGQRVDCLPPV